MYNSPISAKAFMGLSDKAHVSAIEALLDRIKEVDPYIQAFLPEPERRERVLSDMTGLFRKYPEALSRPPLFGIPIGIKDIFRATGFETRAGSLLPPDIFSGEESVAVTLLKAAGALILGKTATTEFAYFQPGPTCNPWNPCHTPGGSSSGSAAAVSAGFCPIAVGTQTIGSINRPASYCGITGFKPSYGRISTRGIIPFSPSADHPGILAADVLSARMTSNILLSPPVYQERNIAPQDSVILIAEDSYTAQASDEALRTVEKTAEALSSAGYRIKKTAIIDSAEEINEAHKKMIAGEFTKCHRKWYGTYSALYSEHSRKLFEEGKAVGEKELMLIRAERIKYRERIDGLLSREKAIALLTPSSKDAAPRGLENTGSPLLNLPWTYAGLPAVTIPAAINPEGLPLGIQIVGSFCRDEELLSLAARIESLLKNRGIK